MSTCYLKDSEVPCPMFSPSLGWRQGWWGPAQFPKQGSRAGWVPQKDAGPWQGDISFLEHQDSDSMPLPILHHTVRWEQEAARRLSRRQQCLLQHTAPTQPGQKARQTPQDSGTNRANSLSQHNSATMLTLQPALEQLGRCAGVMVSRDTGVKSWTTAKLHWCPQDVAALMSQ